MYVLQLPMQKTTNTMRSRIDIVPLDAPKPREAKKKVEDKGPKKKTMLDQYLAGDGEGEDDGAEEASASANVTINEDGSMSMD